MYRLIALDIDGTLLDSQGNVSPKTIQAIAEARRAGVHVVLATGRSAPEAAYFTELTGCDPWAVCLGGGAIADTETFHHVQQWNMKRDAGLQALQLIQSQPLARMVFAGEVNLMDPASDAYFTRHYPYDCFHHHKVVTEDMAAYIQDNGLPVTKLYAVGEPSGFPPLLEQLRQLPELELTSSGSNNFEVMPLGVNKGTTLGLLGQQWGIPLAETAAIGDSDNDLAMLRAVGCPIAMGNGSAAVKEAACYVTASNEEDGVAKAIDHLLRM